MVGVPRSKGCARCRHRRKGCDLQRPVCGGCKAAGTPCEGYDRQRIFVNSFTEDASGSTLPAARYSRGAARNKASQGEGASATAAQAGILPLATPPRAERRSSPPATVNTSLLPGTVNASQLTSIFLMNYLPSGKSIASMDSRWIESLPTLQTADQLVHNTFLAISLCYAGDRTKDLSMTRRGREMYGKALQQVIRAVQIPKAAASVSVQVAVKLFGFIEILYGAAQDEFLPAHQWVAHMDGQVAITKLRPPESYTDGLAHRLFVGSRSYLVTSCLARKVRFGFTSPEWRTVPWSKSPKSDKDRLTDVCIDINEMQCDYEEAKQASSDPDSMAATPQMLKAIWALDNELQNWLLSVGPLKVFREDDGSLVPLRDNDDFALADTTLLYWSTRLMLYHIARKALPDDFQLPAHWQESVYIQKIAQAIPFFFQSGTGILGPLRTTFPLGLFLIHLKEGKGLSAEDRRIILETVNRPLTKPVIGKFLGGEVFQGKVSGGRTIPTQNIFGVQSAA